MSCGVSSRPTMRRCFILMHRLVHCSGLCRRPCVGHTKPRSEVQRLSWSDSRRGAQTHCVREMRSRKRRRARKKRQGEERTEVRKRKRRWRFRGATSRRRCGL
ncbi:uncharacterized protein Tco025E_00123 [Trypanosoma conorhini]|uniref:Uncharacterized protein n=1 Tax=Trypanosoma conorhini TaxID=83891 RepID=A0A3R7LI54_9TRYP|nr:uncharacterized protein Tco025E_00123 [Trypanosoma conorhini]RNF27739.1 hypothetical protein Tco025E_00123 [Trypanosoma conorhini]